MQTALQLFVCILLHLTGAASLGNVREGQHVIYVDAQYGTSDRTCWNGGKEHPCNSLDFAMEGAQQTNSSVTVINLQQGQCPAPATDNHLCSGKLENGESGSVEAFSVSNSADSCPTWLQVNDSADCVCGSSAGGVVQCDSKSEQVHILACNCMTYDNSGKFLVVGNCPYACKNWQPHHLSQNASKLDEQQCGHYNRRGQLCGQCKEGFFSLQYDLHCINCSSASHGWVQFFVSTLGSVTVFFMFVIIFRISVTSASLNAFILVSQIVSSPIILRFCDIYLYENSFDHFTLYTVQSIGEISIFTLYGFWNLDFFHLLIPPTCLPLTPLQSLAVEYIVAVYPLALIFLTYTLIELHAHNFRPIVYLWKPFHKCFVLIRRQWDIRTSIIDAFATFLLLSYVKLFNVSFDILVPISLYDINGTKLDTLYLYYDATIPFFSKEHLPYAILAVTIFVVFNLVPIVLLTLYPMRCFQRCLTRCNLQCHALRAFMDSFQGCYKDGTDGTRDCRYFSVAYLILRIAILVVLAASKYDILYTLFVVMLLSVVITIIVIFQPYKVRIYNIMDIVLFFALSTAVTSNVINSLALMQRNTFMKISEALISLSLTLPLCYVIGLFIWWIFVRKKLPQNCFHRLRGQRNGYVQIAGLEDSLPDRLVNPEHYVNLAN